MPIIIALNFRETLGFLTDPANTVFLGGEGGAAAGANYPTSKNSGNGAVNVGYLGSDLVGNLRNRETSNPKTGGLQWSSGNFPISFQVDLPSAGTYKIRVALGDRTGGAVAVSSKIYDGTTSGTLKATLFSDAQTTGQYMDASGVIRTSASDWESNNVGVDIVFATTTFTITLERDLAPISHLSIESVASTFTKTGTGYLSFKGSGTDEVPRFGAGFSKAELTASGLRNATYGETGTGRMGFKAFGATAGITHTKQNGKASIRLAWDASPDTSVDNYKLYWNLNSPGPPYPFTSGPLGNVTTALLTGLDRGSYEFVVTCSNVAGESPPSNEVAVALSYGVVFTERGPKVHEFLRQEIARLGCVGSGVSAYVPAVAKIGYAAVGFTGSGHDAVVYNEFGGAVVGFTASGLDVITYSETAKAGTEFIGSGPSDSTGPGLFLKSGGAALGFYSQGELASVFGESGYGALEWRGAGVVTQISIPTTVGIAKRRKKSWGRSRIQSLSEDR